MFIIANLLVAIAQVLDYVLWAYIWILIGRVIVSWVNADPYNPLVRFLYSATEPVLERVRRIAPVYAGGFDLSPILVWIAVIFIQQFVVRSLYDLARVLGSGM
ncbi:MAG TPA: YggT family protein [candidate division Zixibacteria bacterium]|nr:YggT family protein [candidate division Zixibacteria bacterium]